jgi:hypothetical protein
MPFALLLVLAAVGGATILTYIYDREALFWSRLGAGVCAGLAALGLVGFVLASLLGMTPLAVGLSGLVVGSPLLLLSNRAWRARLSVDAREAVRVLRPSDGRGRRGAGGTIFFYLSLAVLFWLVFSNAMYRNEQGIFTGLDTNLGDLPFHISLVTSFAYGENFPPEHTEFAGAKLTYPFIADFVTAMLVRAGATLEGAFFWQNFLTMMAVLGLLHRWALRLTGDRLAAVIAALLVIFSGGLGWYVFFGEAAESGRGVLGQLNHLAHDYTRIPQGGYAWANAVTALFVPQRGILLGFGLALMVWTLWWGEAVAEGERRKEKSKGRKAESGGRRRREREARGASHVAQVASGAEAEKRERTNEGVPFIKRLLAPEREAAGSSFEANFVGSSLSWRSMLAAGLLTGLLPLVHAHSFAVMMVAGACLALLQLSLTWSGSRGESEAESGAAHERLRRVALLWAGFACAALLLAGPQMLWATSGSEVRAGRFFGWEFGWDHGTENVLWFWLKNTGVFIPLLAVALLWRGGRAPVPARLLYFYLPFTLCFMVPNVYRLSPWVWDNIKVLFYWWVASAPLVALVLVRLWRVRAWGWAAALVLLLAQTFAGGLDVWRAASGAVAHMTFDANGIAFAEMIKSRTEPRALILHAPTYNDPVYLSGRRTFLGYTGHLWSHGLDYAMREAVLKRIYAGAPEAGRLLTQNEIDYVVVGPLERAQAGGVGSLNERFFERYKKVGEVGEYRLYKTRP